MSNITKEINGKEYTFDVTTLDIKLVDYGGCLWYRHQSRRKGQMQ